MNETGQAPNLKVGRGEKRGPRWSKGCNYSGFQEREQIL